MTLKVDTRQIIHALSDTLDLVGVDDVQHGKRVAFMAMQCGKDLNYDLPSMRTLYHAALLHDCGVSSTRVHHKLVTELDWRESQYHCLRGEQLLSSCQLFHDLPAIIRYHHTHYENMPASIDRKTALMSNLIYLVDRVDALIAQHKDVDILIARKDICRIISKYSGTFFEESLVDTFLKIAACEIFWLSLEPRHIINYCMDMGQKSQKQIVDQDIIMEVATIFAEIVDAKSTFTVEHSFGVARLSRYIGSLLCLSGAKQDMLEAAGLLHDLGKLIIPDEILEKPGPLTEEEKAIMMRHSFESYQILYRIDGFEKIARWAAFHHETLSGKGYPFHLNEDGLELEARIIAVADIFQALSQKRPYRDSLPSEKIMAIVNNMAAEGHLDHQLISLVESHLDECLRKATCVE